MGSCNDVGLAGTRASMLLCILLHVLNLQTALHGGCFLFLFFFSCLLCNIFWLLLMCRRGYFPHATHVGITVSSRNNMMTSWTTLPCTDCFWWWLMSNLPQCHIGQLCFQCHFLFLFLFAVENSLFFFCLTGWLLICFLLQWTRWWVPHMLIVGFLFLFLFPAFVE